MSEQVQVIYDGQTYSFSPDVAGNDELLRQVLSTLSPALADAQIERKPDGTIHVIARKGTKGSDVMSILDAAPTEVNPAILLANCYQGQPLTHRLSIYDDPEEQNYLDDTIADSRAWDNSIQQALSTLGKATGISFPPVGF
jgi:hypothetical protein